MVTLLRFPLFLGVIPEYYCVNIVIKYQAYRFSLVFSIDCKFSVNILLLNKYYPARVFSSVYILLLIINLLSCRFSKMFITVTLVI